jgi:hypothetical protein
MNISAMNVVLKSTNEEIIALVPFNWSKYPKTMEEMIVEVIS